MAKCLVAGEWKSRQSLKLRRCRLRKQKEPKLHSDLQEPPGRPLRRDCGSLRCPPRLHWASPTKPASRQRGAPRAETPLYFGHQPRLADRPSDKDEVRELGLGPKKTALRSLPSLRSTVSSSARSLRHRVCRALLCALPLLQSHASHHRRCRPRAKVFPCRENRASQAVWQEQPDGASATPGR